MADDKKYYWLRLDRNFFKRHDIRIIENMENGKEYVLFYMKLLLESIDHVGNLRFNELIPYNESMLGTITNTNIDIVRSAIKLFENLDMLEILDDQTIYITDTKKMLGEAKSADRVRRFREKQKQIPDVTGCNVTETLHVTEIEKEIEIESDIDKKKKSSHFVPPTLEEVKAYCTERKNNVNPQKFFDYFNTPDAQGRTWIDSKGNKVKNWKQKIITWEQHSSSDSSKKPDQPKPNKFNSHPTRGYTAEDYSAIEQALRNKGL
jgi:predicted phage replisome organizer